MNRPSGTLRSRIALVVSVVIVVSLYVLTRERTLPKPELEKVVETFRFARTPLPEAPGHPPYK